MRVLPPHSQFAVWCIQTRAHTHMGEQRTKSTLSIMNCLYHRDIFHTDFGSVTSIIRWHCFVCVVCPWKSLKCIVTAQNPSAQCQTNFKYRCLHGFFPLISGHSPPSTMLVKYHIYACKRWTVDKNIKRKWKSSFPRSVIQWRLIGSTPKGEHIKTNGDKMYPLSSSCNAIL